MYFVTEMRRKNCTSQISKRTYILHVLLYAHAIHITLTKVTKAKYITSELSRYDESELHSVGHIFRLLSM